MGDDNYSGKSNKIIICVLSLLMIVVVSLIIIINSEIHSKAVYNGLGDKYISGRDDIEIQKPVY